MDVAVACSGIFNILALSKQQTEHRKKAHWLTTLRDTKLQKNLKIKTERQVAWLGREVDATGQTVKYHLGNMSIHIKKQKLRPLDSQRRAITPLLNATTLGEFWLNFDMTL